MRMGTRYSVLSSSGLLSDRSIDKLVVRECLKRYLSRTVVSSVGLMTRRNDSLRSTKDSMARKIRDEFTSWHTEKEPVICPLCDREIPDDQIEQHHLVPKSKGGKLTVALHRVCHRQIHALFSDGELAKKFSTIDALLEDPAIEKFVSWVKTKPPGFSDAAKESSRQSSGSRR